MTHRVVLIPGDGIGPEVATATRLVLDATGVDLAWEERPAGGAALESHGALLPETTLEAIRECRTAIKGPITTPVGEGFRSVNVALRQGLDLFAAVRHRRTASSVPSGSRAPSVSSAEAPAGRCSHPRSTPVASSTNRVAAATSGPIPSPGIRTTSCVIERDATR